MPTETEWETAALVGALEQMDDEAWQWTQSAYGAYPGFRPASSAVGEYNGKLMIGQMALRGGASVTPAGHARPTYRNFFRPEQRWMVSGLLARDAAADYPGHPLSHNSEFAADVIAALCSRKKTLSPKYFYDATGSDHFEAICLVDEYIDHGHHEPDGERKQQQQAARLVDCHARFDVCASIVAHRNSRFSDSNSQAWRSNPAGTTAAHKSKLCWGDW